MSSRAISASPLLPRPRRLVLAIWPTAISLISLTAAVSLPVTTAGLSPPLPLLGTTPPLIKAITVTATSPLLPLWSVTVGQNMAIQTAVRLTVKVCPDAIAIRHVILEASLIWLRFFGPILNRPRSQRIRPSHQLTVGSGRPITLNRSHLRPRN